MFIGKHLYKLLQNKINKKEKTIVVKEVIKMIRRVFGGMKDEYEEVIIN